jgi:hypothetical protein
MGTKHLTLLLLVASLSACGNSHELYWNGVRADGESWFGGEASYKSVSWNRREPTVTRWVPQGSTEPSGVADTVWLESEAQEILGDRPRFAIRLPGGTVLRSSQFTVEWLDPQSHTPGMIPGSTAVVEYPNGDLHAYFDEYGRLRRIVVRSLTRASEDQPRGRGIALGDHSGTDQLPLPATRDQLVEVFGEPALEKKLPKRICFGPC